MARIRGSGRNIFVARANNVGKCEKCGAFLASEDVVRAGNCILRCPVCGKVISFASFGFRREDKKWIRVRWLGYKGRWRSKPPAKKFVFLGMLVVREYT